MRNGLRSRTPATFALVAALSGCLFDPNGLDVLVTLDDTQLGPDDTMIIQVITTNLDQDPVEIVGTSCPGAFEVLDSDGEVVAPGPTLCPLVLMAPVHLESGESHVATYQWVGDSAPDGERLPRGIYRIRAWSDEIGGERLFGRDQRIIVR